MRASSEQGEVTFGGACRVTQPVTGVGGRRRGEERVALWQTRKRKGREEGGMRGPFLEQARDSPSLRLLHIKGQRAMGPTVALESESAL